MPFIWDDCEWLLVDDEDPYDKYQFVVARKLSVKPNTDRYDKLSIEGFSVEQIRRQIRKFGEIESIEILAKDELEAHVTFVSDRSAYLMLLQDEYNKKMKMKYPFKVEPVDSWEQPKENFNPPAELDMEQTSEIFMLNEDCLLHLFKFLDLDSLVNMANVCKMFNRLMHQYCFPRIQKCKVNCEHTTLTLAKVRRTLLCIGQHLTDFSYVAEYEYNEDDGEYNDTCCTSKFLRIIAKNIGQNIRRACFFFDIGKDNRIAMIAPILQHLELLEIKDEERILVQDIDFHTLCPNLIDFKVRMGMPMIACCKPWPTLRSLSVECNLELDANTLISFIEQNPQITCLEFTVRSTNVGPIILAITNHLSRLEKLTICGLFYVSLSAIAKLNKLPLLREIALRGLDADNLKVVIDQLSLFGNLRKIKLSSCHAGNVETEDYKQSLLKLAKHQQNLEELMLLGVPINEKILVELVSSAQQLKALYIRYRKLDVSNELIVKLVEVLNCYRHESDEALQLYLDKANLEKLNAAENLKSQRYLQLNLFKY